MINEQITEPFIEFKNSPDTSTPINANNLNGMQVQIIETINEKEKEINEQIKNDKVYSETEKEIGTWIDGKKLYRKVISNIGSISYSDEKAQLPHNITNLDMIVRFDGIVKDSVNGWYPLPYATHLGEYQIGCYINENYICVEQDVYNNRLSNYIFILEYTKK